MQFLHPAPEPIHTTVTSSHITDHTVKEGTTSPLRMTTATIMTTTAALTEITTEELTTTAVVMTNVPEGATTAGRFFYSHRQTSSHGVYM